MDHILILEDGSVCTCRSYCTNSFTFRTFLKSDNSMSIEMKTEHFIQSGGEKSLKLLAA